jgi:hypothetical protein
MFTAPVLLATVLSATPPPLARAEVDFGPDSAHVLAYDTTGEVAAEIVIWAHAEEIRLDAVLPDGSSLNASILDGNLTVECDDCQAAGAQIVEVQNLLHDMDSQASWLKCAAYTAITIGEIAHVNPWAVATAVLAACECLPEIVDEFEGMECF